MIPNGNIFVLYYLVIYPVKHRQKSVESSFSTFLSRKRVQTVGREKYSRSVFLCKKFEWVDQWYKTNTIELQLKKQQATKNPSMLLITQCTYSI